jgi:hypothetical protein
MAFKMSGMSSDICRCTCKLDLSGIHYSKTYLAFLESDFYLFFNIMGHKLLSTKIHDYFITKLIYIKRTASNTINEGTVFNAKFS